MLRNRTLRIIADQICGDASYFTYRTGSLLQEFMEDCGFDESFAGTRRWWVVDRLKEALADPAPGPHSLGWRLLAWTAAPSTRALQRIVNLSVLLHLTQSVSAPSIGLLEISNSLGLLKPPPG